MGCKKNEACYNVSAYILERSVYFRVLWKELTVKVLTQIYGGIADECSFRADSKNRYCAGSCD